MGRPAISAKVLAAAVVLVSAMLAVDNKATKADGGSVLDGMGPVWAIYARCQPFCAARRN
jgi:hypothetical protein